MTNNPSDPGDLRSEDEPVWETFEFAVEGDRPLQHAHRIEKILSDAPGVDRVEPHETQERVLVRYNSRRTTPAELHARLETSGYKPAPRAD